METNRTFFWTLTSWKVYSPPFAEAWHFCVGYVTPCHNLNIMQVQPLVKSSPFLFTSNLAELLLPVCSEWTFSRTALSHADHSAPFCLTTFCSALAHTLATECSFLFKFFLENLSSLSPKIIFTLLLVCYGTGTECFYLTCHVGDVVSLWPSQKPPREWSTVAPQAA